MTSTQSDNRRIPIPWVQRWRRLRHRFLPVITFAACVVLTAWVWQAHTHLPVTVGQVETVNVQVNSGVDGTLDSSSRKWELFETVLADQIVAQLDNRPTMAALETLRLEIVRLGAELDAAAIRLKQDAADHRLDYQSQSERLAWRLAQIRLDVLDRRAAIETDNVRLQRQQDRLSRIMRMPKDVVTELELLQAQARRDVLVQQIKSGKEALKELNRQKKDAAERLGKLPAPVSGAAEKLLAPIRSEIAKQNSLIAQLALGVESLQIRSPISGKVAVIFRRPGEAVRAGDPILAIAADRSDTIVTYVRQDQRILPTVGMAVDVKQRNPGSVLRRTRVVSVGPQFEPVPLHQLRNQQMQELGLPVRIALPDNLESHPGELVDITFRAQASSSQPAS